jgi:hypothetical protein
MEHSQIGRTYNDRYISFHSETKKELVLAFGLNRKYKSIMWALRIKETTGTMWTGGQMWIITEGKLQKRYALQTVSKSVLNILPILLFPSPTWLSSLKSSYFFYIRIHLFYLIIIQS